MEYTPLRQETVHGKRVIQLAFVKPNPETSGLMSRIASWLTAQPGSRHTFSHVELRFSDGFVTSITEDPGVVHYEDGRLFSNSRYRSWLELHVTPQEERLMQGYAQAMYEKQVPFNKMGMYWNFIPCCACFPVRRTEDAFFCSEYITMVLQQGGYFLELDPATTSPTMLHKALQSSGEAKMSFNSELYNYRHQQKQRTGAPSRPLLLPPLTIFESDGLKRKR